MTALVTWREHHVVMSERLVAIRSAVATNDNMVIMVTGDGRPI